MTPPLSKKGRSKKKHLHAARAAARFGQLPEPIQKAIVQDLRAETNRKMAAEIALQPKRTAAPSVAPPPAAMVALAAAAMLVGSRR